MTLSSRFAAGLAIVGNTCDAIGGLYLAYDVFRRHAGPLGFLTRAATYGVVLAVPSWLALGPPFGAILGCGFGSLLSAEFWLLARRQRLLRSSPLSQSWRSGAARGIILGLAAMPRFGRRFGLVLMACEAFLLALVYGCGLVPTYRLSQARFALSRAAIRGAISRSSTMGVAAGLAALIVRGPGAAESFGALVGFLVALSGLFISMIVPFVEYWTENASDGFFIFAGLALLFCGLVCDSIPHAVILLTSR